ncbi:MAG: SAM-dependent methyltransferase [Nitrososphaeraceae archaeon]
MKLKDAKKDYFRKLAKEKGYKSRAAFKLIQINKSYRLIKNNINILDIGSAPGGWLQVIVENIFIKNNRGKIIGIDKKKIDPIYGTTIIRGDIEDPDIISEIMQISTSKIDLILSDISPNISGFWEVDHAKQIELSKSVFELTKKIIQKDGNVVFKVFQGDMLNDFIHELRKYFQKVIISKPKASRQTSSEVYLICIKWTK